MDSRRLIVGGALWLYVCLAVGCVDHSARYGRAVIKVGEQEIFLKREGRGVSYDHLFISADKTLDDMPQLNRDFELPFAGLPVYYKVEGHTLHLYAASAAQPAIRAESFPVEIREHILSPTEKQRLGEDYRSLGLSAVAVEFDDSLRR